MDVEFGLNVIANVYPVGSDEFEYNGFVRNTAFSIVKLEK